MSNGVLRYIDFTFTQNLYDKGHGRFIISYKKNEETKISVFGAITEQTQFVSRITISGDDEQIGNLKSHFSTFFDNVLNTPAETYQERFDRFVEEEVERRILGLNWLGRLFVKKLKKIAQK